VKIGDKMSKIQVQVDARNIVDEIEKLMDLHYKEAKERGFAESYPNRFEKMGREKVKVVLR